MATYWDCISKVIKKMRPDEKGMLKCILEYGKKIEKDEDIKTMFNSTKALKNYGKDVTVGWVSATLDTVFTEGLGIMDEFKNISGNYGKQLDITINKVLIKSLKVSKPEFSKDADTVEGAIQREIWIAEQYIDSFINNMPDDVKEEFMKEVAKTMRWKWIAPSKAATASTALFTGGLTAARSIMGFGFHKMVAIIANRVAKMLVGRGLSLAANAALQRSVGLLFGPIGWIITVVLTLSSIPSLVNPRGYDKYIPAIVLIGMIRLSRCGGKKIIQSI